VLNNTPVPYHSEQNIFEKIVEVINIDPNKMSNNTPTLNYPSDQDI
jgi:hypothetical protein